MAVHRAVPAGHGLQRAGFNGSQVLTTVGESTWLIGKHAFAYEDADDVSRRVVDTITTAESPRPAVPVRTWSSRR
ncbi:hypothetical protein [Streptomyces sp. NPDC059575]|uniref:hypothetical protein n=1 Tax=Streptomyces sp. NPDC059575 TaxID=3346872 RepID=UPI00367FB45B